MRAMHVSGTSAPGRRTACTTAAARGLQVVEHEAGVAIAAVHEIDLYPAQILHGAIVYDYLETLAIQYTIVIVDGVAEGHSEADTAAPARGREYPHTQNACVHLSKQLLHLGLGRSGKGDLVIRQCTIHSIRDRKSTRLNSSHRT